MLGKTTNMDMFRKEIMIFLANLVMIISNVEISLSQTQDKTYIKSEKMSLLINYNCL